MMMTPANKFMEILPYKLKKRINKTGEGRSGLEIYKRRNRRNYRVIIQYTTWNNIIINNPNFLDNFQEGYVVLISPEEYFGNNYPNSAIDINPNFILGKTGFIYYSSISELKNFKPLQNWSEVYELNTTGSKEQITWIGEYVLNIKNSKPPHISDICYNAKNKNDKSDKVNRVKNNVDKYLYSIPNTNLYLSDNYPEQSGLGNYDYDYANTEMINMVKLQMLYLMLNCCGDDGETFAKFILDNLNIVKDINDTNYFKTLIQNRDDYIIKFKENLQQLKNECIKLNLIDTNSLCNNNITYNNTTICPLCSKQITPNDFFVEITQQEGRQVKDNTQREIVLMHINALRPGTLNHRIYNLGWGHNFCNTIQGDKDIDETICELEKIVKNYKTHKNIINP